MAGEELKPQGQSQGGCNTDGDHAQQGGQIDAAGDQKPSTTTKGYSQPQQQQQGSCKPGSSRWQQRVADPTCAYFLSDEFKSSAQLAAGDATGCVSASCSSQKILYIT